MDDLQNLQQFVSQTVEAKTMSDAAHGDVLVVGLGLALSVRAILDKPFVQSVTVLEINPDVISLIEPTLKHRKVKIIQGDAFNWTPPKKAYDLVYFDIWQAVPNGDNRNQVKQLRSRHRSSLKKGGRTMAWCEDRL